jgi:hypothetical protein
MSAAALIELTRLPPLSAGWRSDEGSLVSQRVVTGAVRIMDGAIVALVGLAIALAYVSEPIMTRDVNYAFLLAFSTAVTIGVFQFLRLYDPARLSSFIARASGLDGHARHHWLVPRLHEGLAGLLPRLA